MTAHGEAAGGEAAPHLYDHVTCPFCGLHCDDLQVERKGTALRVRKNGCQKADAGFERSLPPAKPAVEGREVALDEAIGTAARLVAKSALPLFSGLATDVDGMRAVMSLADRAGGIIDHAMSEAQYRNLRVLQTSGWINSTLTEARNRADLIIIVGGDIAEPHPRFFERIVSPAQSMFDEPSKRTLVFLGGGPDSSLASQARVGEVVTIPCPLDRVSDVLGVLHARLRGAFVGATEVAGVSLAEIDALGERCRKAAYGVFVWAPPNLTYPHADLTVHLISEIVKDLNVATRFAGLPLGGAEGSVTAAAVSGWQGGYPLRTSYARGSPEFDPMRYAGRSLIANGDVDLLVWIASFTPDIAPPETSIPTVLIGTPGIVTSRPPAVFIPIGTPGLDHAGSIVRCDSVVSLPLRNLWRSSLPRAADVLAAIEQAL